MTDFDHRKIARIANVVAPLFDTHDWEWVSGTNRSIPTAAEIALCVRDVVAELAGRTEDGSVGTGRLSFVRTSDDEGAEVGVYLHLGTFEFGVPAPPAELTEAQRHADIPAAFIAPDEDGELWLVCQRCNGSLDSIEAGGWLGPLVTLARTHACSGGQDGGQAEGGR